AAVRPVRLGSAWPVRGRPARQAAQHQDHASAISLRRDHGDRGHPAETGHPGGQPRPRPPPTRCGPRRAAVPGETRPRPGPPRGAAPASGPPLPAAAGAALRFQGSHALDWAKPEDDASPGQELAAAPPGATAPGATATAWPEAVAPAMQDPADTADLSA